MFKLIILYIGFMVFVAHASKADEILLGGDSPSPRNITIMADPSMTVAISKIARAYSHKNNITVSAIFSSTKEQILQITDGADADVLITKRVDGRLR